MSYRLLIVEDTPALLQAISVFFREKGAGIWTVVTSSNGNEALELVRSEEFDLMILDMLLGWPQGLWSTDGRVITRHFFCFKGNELKSERY